MRHLLVILFALTVALAPLPLGSNRDWAWSPLAAVAGILIIAPPGEPQSEAIIFIGDAEPVADRCEAVGARRRILFLIGEINHR